MTDREIMQQALNALEEEAAWLGSTPKGAAAITALRERLAQPETEAEIYKRLYELRGKALDRPCSRCGYQPKRIFPMSQPEQSRAEKMRDAGYTRRPTLREIASEDEHLFYAPGDVLICKESDERVVVKHGNTGPMQLANGKIALEWSDEIYGEYTLEQVMDGFIREGYAPRSEQPEQKQGFAASLAHNALPRREWVGLTEEEIEQACVPLGAAMLSFTEVARAIEAKLKEKNNG